MFTKPPIEKLYQKDFEMLYPPGEDALPFVLAARRSSVLLGVLTAIVLGLLNPAAGFLIAIQNTAIHYTSVIYLEALPALMSTCSVLCYIVWRKYYDAEVNTSRISKKDSWLLMSAVFLGLAIAGKYIFGLAGLVKPDAAPDESKQTRMHEDSLHRQPTPKVALPSSRGIVLLDIRAGGFEEIRVVHTCRAGGGAGKTAEAVIHFIGKGPAQGHVSIGNGTHPGDAPARTVSLHSRADVGWTRRQAHPAMHALLQDGIVHPLKSKWCLNPAHTSKIFPGFSNPFGSRLALTFFRSV